MTRVNRNSSTASTSSSSLANQLASFEKNLLASVDKELQAIVQKFESGFDALVGKSGSTGGATGSTGAAGGGSKGGKARSHKAHAHGATGHKAKSPHAKSHKAKGSKTHKGSKTQKSHGTSGGVPKTVQAAAQALLKSKNVSFWSGLSTGSDRKNLVRLAKGQKAFVPATGQYVVPKLKMMQALVEMSKHGRIMINALTGGHHTTGSNHYRGTAVDLDLSTGDTSMITRIAAKYGGRRNSETSHIHLDF